MGKQRPFFDPVKEPGEQVIARVLGHSSPFYHQLLGLTAQFMKQWHFYKKSGWLLKIYDKKKALFYIIPFSESFDVNFTIREGERWAFLKDEDLAYLKERLEDAKKYPEGFMLQFTVKDETTFNEFLPLAEKLVKVRLNREASAL